MKRKKKSKVQFLGIKTCKLIYARQKKSERGLLVIKQKRVFTPFPFFP